MYDKFYKFINIDNYFAFIMRHCIDKDNILYVHRFESWLDQELIKMLFSKKIIKYYFAKKPKKNFYSKRELILIDILNLISLLFKWRLLSGVRTIYLNGLHFSFFIYLKLFGNKNMRVVIANFYIHGLSKKMWFNTFLKILFNKNKYIIIAQSEYEVQYFKSLGESLTIYYIPFCAERLNMLALTKFENNKKYIFSGGYSNRDYDLLFEAASKVLNINFIVVASELNILKRVPKNIEVFKEVTPNEFNNLLYNSYAVIIPLKESSGSSGQMVALTAMQMSKGIIYTDFPVLSQYFDIESGISMKGGSLVEMIDSLNKAWNNPTILDKMGKKSEKRYSMYFSKENYNNKVASILNI